jgi:hypothetical protein
VTSKLLARGIEVTALHAPFDAKPPAEAAADTGFSFDTAKAEAAIGLKDRVNSGVYQFGTVPGAMGTATAINFEPMDDSKAALRRISWLCLAKGRAFASSLLLREARATGHPDEP